MLTQYKICKYGFRYNVRQTKYVTVNDIYIITVRIELCSLLDHIMGNIGFC
jgi:hypothetical protein